MKCIKEKCPYFIEGLEVSGDAYDYCNIFNEGYEIINDECLIEDHIKCGRYELEVAEKQLRLLSNINKKIKN